MLNALLDNRVNAQESGILNLLLHTIKEKMKKMEKMKCIVAGRFRRVLVHYKTELAIVYDNSAGEQCENIYNLRRRVRYRRPPARLGYLKRRPSKGNNIKGKGCWTSADELRGKGRAG